MASSDRKPRLEIDASVVYQLGEQLISDETQALVELVKNAYDADASFANVVVDTTVRSASRSVFYPTASGYILIEDDGVGMDWEDIRKGWLTISASPKRESKAQGRTTQRGRTPLGDKGLGRLGSQRLGDNLEIRSIKKGTDTEARVGLCWRDFQGSLLSSVPVLYDESAVKPTRHGTSVLISDLKNPDRWQGKDRDELVRRLSELIFPFGEVRPFDVYLTVDGARIELDRVSEAVLDVANIQFEFTYDGSVLQIDGKYRLTALLKPESGAQEEFQRILGADAGADFYAYLSKNRTWRIPELKWVGADGWFVALHEEYSLADLKGTSLLSSSTPSHPVDDDVPSPANPGPFVGKIYSFILKSTDLASISDVFSLQADFNEFVKAHSGVRVFRDGFGIRPFGLGGNDWLALGSGWTSAKSYYGLRPDNVIGYVSLSAKNNGCLVEATDREGFVDSPHSRNFQLLAQRVVRTINDTNTRLRRGYNDYVRSQAQKAGGIEPETTEQIFERMRETSSRSVALTVQVEATQRKIESTAARVAAVAEDVAATPLFHSEEEVAATHLLEDVRSVLEDARLTLAQVTTMLGPAKEIGRIADVLEPDLRHLQDELAQFSELAGLGMTAEALSHEISIIADGLAARSKEVSSRLKGQISEANSHVVAFTEHVQTAVSRIRKQLGHLDPSMRYVRERRDEIRIGDLCKEMYDFYHERLARSNIQISLTEPFDDFTVLMNKGKLIQVLDNLILNSEYWLRDDLKTGQIGEAIIHLQCAPPYLDISDSGVGISPSVEHYLFQPFVTTKPKGVGRGLGLFIARQLLESSGCAISLLPLRNQYDRRYVFRIDFTGALHV